MTNQSGFFLAIKIIFIVNMVMCNYHKSILQNHDEDMTEPHMRVYDKIERQGKSKNDYKNVKYRVALHNGTDVICSGSILGNKHVLTAAQCVYGAEGLISGPFYILIGTNQLVSASESVAMVEKVYIPVSFNGNTDKIQPADIAVLKLNKKLRLNTDSSIKKVKLPKPLFDDVYNPYEKKNGVISGYGIEDLNVTGKSISKTLLIGTAYVLPQKECVKAWEEYTKIEQNQLCARIVRGNSFHGICVDESGSGLIYNKTIIGVKSIGNAFCYDDNKDDVKPMVYTKVSSWIQFIKNAMADNNTISDDIRSFTLGNVTLNSNALATHDQLSINDKWIVFWNTFVMVVTMFL